LCQLDSHFNLPFEFRAQTPPIHYRLK
jgi:hypothetical protein